MSMLSSLTGIGLNPFGKTKVKIDPKKALMTALTVGSMGSFGPVGGVLSKIPGAAKAAGVIGGLKKVVSGGNQAGAPSSVGGMAGAADMASGGDGGGLLRKVGGFLGDHGDQMLGAASLGEGFLGQRKANNYQNEALNIGRQSYADRAGLRKLGIQGMMNEQAPDLTDTFAQPSNPYGKLRRVG